MKKSILLLLSLFIILVSCEPEVKHEHTWGEWTTSKTATCSENGLSIRKCTSCGEQDKETKVIKALGHSLSETGTVTKEATCGTDGEETFSCTREGCDHSETKTISKTGNHTYGSEITKEATCTEDGKTYKLCSVCNAENVISTTNAKGHTYKYESDKDGHNQKCSVCSAQTQKNNHTFGEWTTDTEATETTEGKKSRTCSTCEYKEEDTISKKVHVCVASTNYGYDETNHWKKCIGTTCTAKLEETTHTLTESTTKAATCTSDGEKTYKCNTCGYEKKETIAATPNIHTLKEEKTVAATCTTAGEKYKLCSVCNQKYDDSTIEATGHTEQEQKTENATCTAAGRTYKICSVCNGEYDITTIPATDHNWGEWTTKTAGTCATNAKLSRSCNKCSATEEKDGDKNSSVHPTESLVWKSETTSFLTKTEKKEYCNACNQYTGDTKTDYDSIEGYWVSDAITESYDENNYSRYLYISMDNEGNAVMENLSLNSGKMMGGYLQSYTYEWVYGDTYNTSLRTNIIFKTTTETMTHEYNYSVTEDDSGKITITNASTTSSFGSTYTLARKLTETHTTHTYSGEAENFDDYTHICPSSCDKKFHETIYKYEDHNFNANKTCKVCGYTQPYEIPLFVYQLTNGTASSEATWSFYSHKLDRNTTLYPTSTYSCKGTNSDGTTYDVTINNITKWKTVAVGGAETEYSISDSTPIQLQDGMTLYIYYSTDTTQ